MGFVAYSLIYYFIGISQQEYLAAVRAGGDIIWFVYHVIRVTEPSTDILQSEEFNPPLSDESANFFFNQSTVWSASQTSYQRIILSTEGCGTSQPVANVKKIMDSASKRGKRNVIDTCSSGYGYIEKRQHVIATNWQCIVWPITRNCLFG